MNEDLMSVSMPLVAYNELKGYALLKERILKSAQEEDRLHFEYLRAKLDDIFSGKFKGVDIRVIENRNPLDPLPSDRSRKIVLEFDI